jgi:hypothetical protein
VPSLAATPGTTSRIAGLVEGMTRSTGIGGIEAALSDAVPGGRLSGLPGASDDARLGALALSCVPTSRRPGGV